MAVGRPLQKIHRHLLFAAVLVAVLISIAPWRWQGTATTISNTPYLGPAVTRLELIQVPIPSREEADNLRLLVHSESVYHQVGFFTLTALCHRTPETELLWSLEPSSREQTLPSGVRVLRTEIVPGAETVMSEDFAVALDRECDVGSFRPLEYTTKYIYWYQPFTAQHDPSWTGDEVTKMRIREIGTYQLEAVIKK
jgi:hypothetical protein